jgi:phage host-nuclease inhibitor protein Gam
MAKVKAPAEPFLKSYDDVDRAAAEQRTLEDEVAVIQAEFEPQFEALRNALTEKIGGKQKLIEQHQTNISQFLVAHAADFVDPRSRELNHVVLGFKLDPPSLDCLTGWNLKKVGAKLKELGRRAFYRAEPVADKESIHSALKDGKLKQDQLADFGLCIKQMDRAWYELKRNPAQPTN